MKTRALRTLEPHNLWVSMADRLGRVAGAVDLSRALRGAVRNPRARMASLLVLSDSVLPDRVRSLTERSLTEGSLMERSLTERTEACAA